MQLVIGCRSKLSQEKLLAEQTIDRGEFLTFMRADESATQTTAAIRQENNIASTKQQVGQRKQIKQQHKTKLHKKNNYTNNSNKTKTKQCFGCGSKTYKYKYASCSAFRQDIYGLLKAEPFRKLLHNFKTTKTIQHKAEAIGIALNKCTICSRVKKTKA